MFRIKSILLEVGTTAFQVGKYDRREPVARVIIYLATQIERNV